MIEELAELSPKIHLEIVDVFSQQQRAKDEGISRVPALVMKPKGKGQPRFFGLPGGYQLFVIVENIKTISRGVSPLSMATRKGLRAINQPVQIQVFVTPTDTECPPVARLAHALAIENENITADVIETEEFPALVQQYGIRSVPMTIINELTQISGFTTEQEFVDKVLQCGVHNESESTDVQA
jgi:glutaredoxin-like protein